MSRVVVAPAGLGAGKPYGAVEVVIHGLAEPRGLAIAAALVVGIGAAAAGVWSTWSAENSTNVTEPEAPPQAKVAEAPAAQPAGPELHAEADASKAAADVETDRYLKALHDASKHPVDEVNHAFFERCDCARQHGGSARAGSHGH